MYLEHRCTLLRRLASFWLLRCTGGWYVLQINVNGASRDGRSRPENWGELLGLLEQGDGLSRQIVTAVRFGGVAVPTFREPTELARELQDLDRIDVETRLGQIDTSLTRALPIDPQRDAYEFRSQLINRLSGLRDRESELRAHESDVSTQLTSEERRIVEFAIGRPKHDGQLRFFRRQN
jgi:hypothetical protein